MNNELLSALFPSTILAFCSGTILIGTLLCLYVFLSSRKALYLSITILGLLGTAVIIFETSVILSGTIYHPAAGYLFHRLQALTVTLFIPAMPFFTRHITEAGNIRFWILTSLFYTGIAFALCCIAVSYQWPEYFLFPKSDFSDYTKLWNIGRGVAGPLYVMRDLIIAGVALICIMYLAIDTFTKHRASHIRFAFIGALIALCTGIADMIIASHERASDGLFTIRVFSIFSIGLTIFVIMSMIGVVKYFIDQTREIEEARKLRSLGILAGGIAHDFNNTLATIVGNISLLRYTHPTEEQCGKSFFEIENAAYKARKLTNQLLTFAKGGGPIRSVTSTRELIEETVSFHLSGSAIKIIYQIPENIWNLNADSGQITQVIQNIVINAKQALSDRGKITVTGSNIESFIRPDTGKEIGPLVKIDITDNGPGIPPKHQKKIFHPYFTTKKNGNGLGLSICYSIINKHNGFISLDSEPGAGTTFHLYLPASNEKVLKLTKEFNVKKTKKYSALILEDEPGIQLILSKMCRLLNIKPTTASTGEEAVKYLKEKITDNQNFDIYIFDLTIVGGMGGIDTAKEVLALVPDAKIVVSSGYSNDPVLADYKEYGFSAFIQKPYRIEEFKSTIIPVLQND